MAPVEPVTELVKIGLKMLGADTMKDVQNPALEVGDDNVHPGKQLGSAFQVSLNHGLMVISESGKSTVGPSLQS